MPRILSIDYGKKRTGLAVTDPLQIIANGLKRATCRYTSILRILFTTGNLFRIQIRACNANFYICANFCSLFFFNLCCALRIENRQIFQSKTAAKASCRASMAGTPKRNFGFRVLW